jgi:hypothetical protein
MHAGSPCHPTGRPAFMAGRSQALYPNELREHIAIIPKTGNLYQLKITCFLYHIKFG